VPVPPPSNVELLAWFPEKERDECVACGKNTCVTLPEAAATFCLACGAVILNGVRVDVDRRLPSDLLSRLPAATEDAEARNSASTEER
jgi:hypothetical protein